MYQITVVDQNKNSIVVRDDFQSSDDAMTWFRSVMKEGYTAEISALPDVDPVALANQKLAEDNRNLKIVSLEQYVGKSLTLSDQKFVLETLLNLLFDPSSTFAKDLILLLSHAKK